MHDTVSTMTLEQLNSLDDDEMAILWFAVNKTTPPVLAGFELEPSVFCAIKPQAILNRVEQIEMAIKEEHKLIYNSLRQKLNMTSIETIETSNSGSVVDSKSE